MKMSHLLAAAGLTAALALPAAAKPGNGGGPPDPKPGPVAKGRPGQAKSQLTSTGVDADAKGTVDVKRFPAVGKRAVREWLRVKAGNLDPAKTYEVWLGAADDPATVGVDDPILPVAVGTLVHDANDPADTGDDSWGVRFDTHKGGLLPHSVALSRLEGQTIEVRDSDGDDLTEDPAVLTGTVPTIGPKK